MATIFRGKVRDEWRLPARYKAVVVVQRAQARESRIDDPKLFASIGHFVDCNISRYVNMPRHIATVVFTFRLNAGRDLPRVVKLSNFARSADPELS